MCHDNFIPGFICGLLASIGVIVAIALISGLIDSTSRWLSSIVKQAIKEVRSERR